MLLCCTSSAKDLKSRNISKIKLGKKLNNQNFIAKKFFFKFKNLNKQNFYENN